MSRVNHWQYVPLIPGRKHICSISHFISQSPKENHQADTHISTLSNNILFQLWQYYSSWLSFLSHSTQSCSSFYTETRNWQHPPVTSKRRDEIQSLLLQNPEVQNSWSHDMATDLWIALPLRMRPQTALLSFWKLLNLHRFSLDLN